MIALSVADVADVLNASVVGSGDSSAVILDLVIDSRAVRPGSLFVALPGERVDGHDYLSAAFERGAVAAVVQHEVPGTPGLSLVVDDPVLALGRLARRIVDAGLSGGLQVVAITGSQGKTSTKDLVAQILERVGPTVAPYGNLNNELGVPLTASRIDVDTRFLVAEMGARGVGHIAYLCDVVPPGVGVVLNVGQAHVGEFGGQAAIARAKGELVEALPPDGTAVLNADDPLVWAMRPRTHASVTAFSAMAEPTWPRAVWATDVVADVLGRCTFQLHLKTEGSHSRGEVELGLSGRHHVVNAVAAAAAATALGLDLDVVVGALREARPRSAARMEIHQRLDDVVVINDAYNSNPDSARAAVDTLAEMGRARLEQHPAARTWALLGDMLELGDTSVAEHDALGRHVAEVGIDRLVAVGGFAAALVAGARSGGLEPDQAVVVADKAAAAAVILPQLRPGDTVLVKASRGLALDTVAEEIWSDVRPRAVSQGPTTTARSTADREDPA